MLSHPRERPSTGHVLRVLVRIDTQVGVACVEVRGCLTAGTYDLLAEILTRTGALGAAVRVNLLRAGHVDSDALQELRNRAGPGPVEILAPPVLPGCRSGLEGAGLPPPGSPLRGRLLSNEEALELAFLRRDPQALAKHPAGQAAQRAPGPQPDAPPV